MKTQVPAKKADGGAGVRSYLPTFSPVSIDAVSGSPPEAELEESVLHTDGYNLANLSIAAKILGNNQRGATNGFSNKLPIQAKLTVGEPNDEYEKEADQVAEQITQKLNVPQTIQPDQIDMIPLDVTQDKDEEDKLQMKPLIQRQSSEGGTAAPPALESSIQKAQGDGQPLADSIRKPMEQRFNSDFRRVRVHTDDQSDQLNRAIQANAFTTKKDIFFRRGKYNPVSLDGQKLVAHELAHVIQQKKMNTSEGKIQRDQADQSLDAAEEQLDYFDSRVESTVEDGKSFADEIKRSPPGQWRDTVALGLYNVSWTLTANTEGPMTEIQEASRLSKKMGNARLAYLGIDTKVNPDLSYYNGTGKTVAKEIKSVTSEDTTSVTGRMKEADAQLGKRTAIVKKILIKIQSPEQHWPIAKNSKTPRTKDNVVLEVIAYAKKLNHATAIDVDGVQTDAGADLIRVVKKGKTWQSRD